MIKKETGMEYEIRNLRDVAFDRIHETMIEAFSDYALDMTYMTRDILHNRAIKNGLDLELSSGVFNGGELVGFTLVGLDDWKGERAAFDIATGIIKDHRGKGLARKMFDHSLPGLREKGIKKFLLEVLQVNEPAIKAYKKAGFEITRELYCYILKKENFTGAGAPPAGIEIQNVNPDDLAGLERIMEWHPSWENSISSVKRIPDGVDIYTASRNGKTLGAIAYYPALDWLLFVVVDKEERRQGIASALLGRILEEDKTGNINLIKINNIQSDDDASIRFFVASGAELYTSQFEMEMDI